MKKDKRIRMLGPADQYSYGTGVVMADRQIQRAMEHCAVTYDDSMGDGKAVLTFPETGKWFLMDGGWGNDHVPTAMLGAACGDVAGSVYEWYNIKYKLDQDHLIHPGARCTDDTVLTCAVAHGLRTGLEQLPSDWLQEPGAEQLLLDSVRDSLRHYGNRYPRAGYGGSFHRWLHAENPAPYHSWGNGSAMRASYAGWVARTLEEAEKLGEISAKVTHNHPEGIKGAVVVAGCIFLLRSGLSKEDVREYAGNYYDLNFTLDEIRPRYAFDVSCAGSVPQAIRAFLEGESFVDVLAGAISIGGDSDTIAAIAGSIAEAIYPIPQDIRGSVLDRLDEYLVRTIAEAVDFAYDRLPD